MLYFGSFPALGPETSIILMKSYYIFVFLYSACISLLQAQDQRISWSEASPLVWNDFKAAPDFDSRFNASTSSGIAFSWSYRSEGSADHFEYDISNFFNPQESWVKPGSKSDHLLKHENLHFDISELHARRFRKLISQYTITKNIKADLNRLYQQSEHARQQMQRKFDKETRHSIDQEAQANWETYIAKELEKLTSFSL